MSRKLTIPDFTIELVDDEGKKTGETRTVVFSMVNIIASNVKMGAEEQMRFWRACTPMMDAEKEATVEIADSDYDCLKKTWFGIEELPIDRQIALISEMLEDAEKVEEGKDAKAN